METFKYDKRKLAAMKTKMNAQLTRLREANQQANELSKKVDTFCADVRKERIEKLKQAQKQ